MKTLKKEDIPKLGKKINQLKKSDKKIKILIEKPLFNEIKKINSRLNNYYYVGYNLRFHPIIQFLKSHIFSVR